MTVSLFKFKTNVAHAAKFEYRDRSQAALHDIYGTQYHSILQ